MQCSGVSTINFQQVNVGWLLVFLSKAQLLSCCNWCTSFFCNTLENIEQPLLTSQEEQEEENFPSSQPHPPQDEQNQQYRLSQIPAQSHSQQQKQDYPQEQEMQPPPYSGPAHTTQPMPYSPYAQQPQVAQPTHVNRNTTVVVTGGAVAVSIFLFKV